MEEKIKEKFEENYKKQLRITKYVILGFFGFFGLLMLIAGIINLSLGIVDSEGFPVGIMLTVFGGIIVLFGVILYFALSKSLDYNKIKERCEKQGAKNIVLLTATVDVQQEKIAELEERIEELESKKDL